MGPIYSLDDFLDMIRRRAGLILLVIAAGSLASVMFALSRQHKYRAYEVIQVAQPNISDTLAKSTVEGSAARRLQLIQQRLMARDSVQEVIDEHGLYADLPGLKPSEKVALLRAAVKIKSVAGARQGFADDGSVSVVSVSAEMASPEQAREIAHEFAQRTIALSRESRIAQARTTLNFLATQEKRLTAEIAALEAEIAAYRKSNELALPGSIESRRSEITALNQALLDIGRQKITVQRAAAQIDESRRKATADRLRSDYAEQVATLDAQSKLLMNRKAELEKSIATAPEIERQIGEYDRKMTHLREQLDAVSTHRSEAEIGFKLESDRLSERMMVIEPAVAPDRPATGSRKKIALLGGVASVIVALALAFLLELRNPVIRTAAQMERELGIRPVVSIPVMDTRRRRGWLGFGRKNRGRAA